MDTFLPLSREEQTRPEQSTTSPMPQTHSTTPPAPLMSKDAAARTLGCDRRTLSRIIDAFDIAPAGTSAAGHPVYELEALREALAEHRAAELPPMTAEEATDGLISLLSFGWLALDYLAETLPAEKLQAAYRAAMERRTRGQEPQLLWVQFWR